MHDSKAWTPLLFLPPFLYLFVTSQFTYTDLMIWFLVKAVGIVGVIYAFFAQFDGVHHDRHSCLSPDEAGFQTEQAYVIRAARTMQWDYFHSTAKGQEMVVDEETLDKALETGDYEFVKRADYSDAGNHIVNDGTDGCGSFVPGGHIVVETEHHYWDKRLN